jgi:hypothetical protein
MKTYLFGHTSPETAYEIKDYPYGRLRTSMFVWVESEPKKGDRVCRMTINPKNGIKNTPKKSTYSTLYVLYINSENGHLESDGGFSIYSEKQKVSDFIQAIGGEEKLTEVQRFNLSELLGIGKPMKRETIKNLDYKVKWEKNHMGTAYHEVKITFDRPDGVSIKEIFQAIKSLDQKKLNECFAGYSSQSWGHVEGFVRVCIRGGMQLTTVKEATYKEWLALDQVNVEADQ